MGFIAGNTTFEYLPFEPCTRTRTLQRTCLGRLAFIHCMQSLAVVSKGSYIDKKVGDSKAIFVVVNG